MKELEDFLIQLTKVVPRDKAGTKTDEINIFSAMFHDKEEVKLHTRFISYLLSPTSKHKQDDFLKLFVRNILRIEKNSFDLENCEVYPNEHDKREYKDIDILIINKAKKQAIIVENKLDAGDSNHDDTNKAEKIEEGYKGQLERYYNTIRTGKGKNDKEVNSDFQCDEDKIHMYYLTLHNKPPSEESVKDLVKRKIPVTVINYHDHVQKWLHSCIEKTNDDFLKKIIQQYLNLIIKVAGDTQKGLAITNLIAENENWKNAYDLFPQFENVKWHIIHRFFTELAKILIDEKTELDENFGKNITEVARGRNTELKLKFDYNGIPLEFVSDGNGLTFGTLKGGKWDFFYFTGNVKEVNFNRFENPETFHLINNGHRADVITEIVKQISEKYDKLPDSISD